MLAAGAATVAAFAGPATAQPRYVRGAVSFEGGAVIPQGEIEIFLEGLADDGPAGQEVTTTRARGDGKSKEIEFVLPLDGTAPPRLEIVARLERADGWLVARGSAAYETAAPIRVVLNPAMC